MFDINKKIQAYKSRTDFVSFDVETTGLRPYHGDRIFSFCFGDPFYCTVIRLDRPNYFYILTSDLLDCICGKKSIKKCIKYLDRSLDDNSRHLGNIYKDFKEVGLVIHNCKFEKGFLKVHGIEIPENMVIHDPMLMSRLLDNQAPSHELGRLVHRLGGDPLGKMIECDKKVGEEAKALGGYQFVNVNLMTEYQLYDAIRPLMLQDTFWPLIQGRKNLLEDYIWEVETALVTQCIEEEGITIHQSNCHKLIKWLDSEINEMQHECFNIIGEYINLSSDKQVGRVLFKKLGFPVVSFTKGGNAQTNKDTIFKLAEEHDHPFLDLLLKWRSYTDGKGNVQKYLDNMDDKGKIHTTINTCQARTHRQSSSKPNLQNVSKESVLKNKYPVPARRCFCCGG